jgi:hypothetical protein
VKSKCTCIEKAAQIAFADADIRLFVVVVFKNSAGGLVFLSNQHIFIHSAKADRDTGAE